MLTSFFGKSNPINFLILGVFIVLGYLLGALSGSSTVITPYLLFNHGFFICLAVLSIFLLDFIIRKNHLTRSNTFAILFFTCFMVMLPVIFLDHKIVLANTFLLLALRRIMSLRSDTNSEKKILDASIWITVASLFYFWSLLLFIPLWIAIVQKRNVTHKQMLVPFVGFLCVFILNTAYNLLAFNSFSWLFNWRDTISFDFSAYNAVSVFIPVTVILVFFIWTGVYRTVKFRTVPLKEKPNYLLLFYIAITCLIIALIGPIKTGAEVLFILAPIAIVSANYIEPNESEIYKQRDKSELWFKEILLWLVVLLPFIFLFL